jgi:hypothetical protein
MKTGKTLRDEGTMSVLQNSSNEWKFEADLCMNKLIALGVPFTSEDLRDAMTIEPHHPNAVGGYWIHAVKRFDLEIVGYKKAEKPKARAHVLPVWVQKGK